MSGRSVAVRVDGDATLGIGHIRRCLALAKALDREGYDVRFVRRQREGAVCTAVSGFRTLWLEDAFGDVAEPDRVLSELKDAEATLALTDGHACERSWVVVDHYGLGRDWESTIRRSRYRVLAIDDFRNRAHCADVLVSASPEPFPPSLNRCETDCLELVGLRYALLDADLAYDESVIGDHDGPPRLLVTFGGSDPTREAAKVCEALRKAGRRASFARVDVVVGPSTPANQVRQWVSGLRGVTVRRSPSSLAALIKNGDLVVTSGGNTMLEALALRKACLVIVTAENQRLIVDGLAARNLIRVIGWHAAVSVRDVEDAVDTMIDGELTALTARVREGSCIDHRGPLRIVAAMRAIEGGRRDRRARE